MKLVWFLALGLVVAGCAGSVPPTAVTPRLELEPGTFSGLLPCADCAGIDATLTLWQPDAGVKGGTYEMRMVYKGKATKPFVAKGTWLLVRGDASGNANATVCELVPDDKSGVWFLKKVGEDGDLRLLDRDRREIDSLMNHTLRRVRL